MSELPLVGQKVKILSFKHNGLLHREWEHSRVLAVSDQYIVVAHKHTRVIESNSRSWCTEPAVAIYYLNGWYNIIGMLRYNGWHFYCNVASPSIYHDGKIKYIDYDLDLKVNEKMEYRILDQVEFQLHRETMRYTKDVDIIVQNGLKELIHMLKMRKGPFSFDFMKDWYEIYSRKYERLDYSYHNRITHRFHRRLPKNKQFKGAANNGV
ncbi:MAG: DUF402 domain-containing protein [Culicoidibacterales bacterium]